MNFYLKLLSVVEKATIAAAIVALIWFGTMLAGCSKVEGLGILGGNAQVIKNYVNSPGATPEAPAGQVAEANGATKGTGIVITTNARIYDGGTALLGKNPSATTTEPEPTTQPAE